MNGVSMRIPGLNMTIQGWMALTCLVAILLWCDRFWKRRAHFLDVAEAHASRVYDYGEGRGMLCCDGAAMQGLSNEEISLFMDQSAIFFAKLEQKYRFAAAHPWLPVAPDPPWPMPARTRRRSEPARRETNIRRRRANLRARRRRFIAIAQVRPQKGLRECMSAWKG
jgi:hypothetical protein